MTKTLFAREDEGATWGPDLADGRKVLHVISDNDMHDALVNLRAAVDATRLQNHLASER